MTLQLIAEFQGQRVQILLRPGQTARVGSSDWVELSIAEDPALAEEHFTIDGRDRWTLFPVGEHLVASETHPLTNGRIWLQDGTTFQAGGTRFSVRIANPSQTEPQAAKGNDHAIDAVSVEAIDGRQAVRNTWPGERDWTMFSWSPAVLQVVQSVTLPQIAAERLFASGELTAALQLIGGSLPIFDAVGWSLRVTGGTPPAELIRWLKEPIDTNRAAVERVFAPQGPASFAPRAPLDWVLQAVLWTGGSLGPESVDPIPPPSYLVAVAAANAVQLQIAASGQSDAAAEAMQAGCRQLDNYFKNPSVVANSMRGNALVSD